MRDLGFYMKDVEVWNSSSMCFRRLRQRSRMACGAGLLLELAIKPLHRGRLIGWTPACGAQGASIARVRSDLLEVPTGSLLVIRAFQTDKPQMRNLRRVSFHGRLLPVCS
jgi:hypothetical protein